MNPIMVDTEVIVNDLLAAADVESDDLTTDAAADMDLRPMPRISIGEVQKGDDAAATMTGTYAFPLLNLVLPRGPQGETGERGPAGPTGATGATGAAAGFGTVSATVDANVGTPSVVVTATGPDTAKNFAFAFSNIKGEQGVQGPAGSDYVLTSADKTEIAAIILGELPFYNGGVSS